MSDERHSVAYIDLIAGQVYLDRQDGQPMAFADVKLTHRYSS